MQNKNLHVACSVILNSIMHRWMAENTKWNYPCCLGAIDGKHIAIQNLSNCGSEFFNYKHFFTVLLLAIVDANYKLIYVDTGAAGRSGDAGAFCKSALKKALNSNTLNLPPAANVEGIFRHKINHKSLCWR